MKRSLVPALVMSAIGFLIAGTAWAGAPIRGVIICGCPKPGVAHRVITVTLNLATTETWVYDPANGSLSPDQPAMAMTTRSGKTADGVAQPQPQELTAGNPIPGIRVVIRNGPYISGTRMKAPAQPVDLAVTDQAADFPTTLPDGPFDLAIDLPASDSVKAVELTFHLTSQGGQLSEAAAPTVTPM